jgi:ribosome-associated translation inhibitor RaiA
MRIETHAANLKLTPALRDYAQTCLWLATRELAGRLAWIGLWLTEYLAEDQLPALSCRITAWVRGVGAIAATHTADDALVAIDRASARLEQALARAARAIARRSCSIHARCQSFALMLGLPKVASWKSKMVSSIQAGDCVRIPDGRIGRVRNTVGNAYRVRVRRETSQSHQFLMFAAKDLRRVDCPKGWMSPAGYLRYLRVTLAKMQRRWERKR